MEAKGGGETEGTPVFQTAKKKKNRPPSRAKKKEKKKKKINRGEGAFPLGGDGGISSKGTQYPS